MIAAVEKGSYFRVGMYALFATVALYVLWFSFVRGTGLGGLDGVPPFTGVEDDLEPSSGGGQGGVESDEWPAAPGGAHGKDT